jgi:hypothetical protein
MLENNLESQTTRRSKDLFPEVHHPLRNGYVSVEELVRDVSNNKPGLFQPLSSFPLRESFPRRGKIAALTNFPLLTQPWELAGDA